MSHVLIAKAAEQLQYCKAHSDDPALSEYGSRIARVIDVASWASVLAGQYDFAGNPYRSTLRWLTEQGREVFGDVTR